jgi:membrane protein DedA with SNARE-associated domain
MTDPLSTQNIFNYLSNYGYYLLFPLVVVEGPITTFITGALVAVGHLNFWLTLLVIVLADSTGDIINYSLGRYSRHVFSRRIEKWMGVNKNKLAKIEKDLTENPTKFLVIGKASHGVGGPILIAAGLLKIDFRRFITVNFLATVVKSFIILTLGYYFGSSTGVFSVGLKYFSIISLGAIILFGWVYGKRIIFAEALDKSLDPEETSNL